MPVVCGVQRGAPRLRGNAMEMSPNEDKRKRNNWGQNPRKKNNMKGEAREDALGVFFFFFLFFFLGL